MVLAERIHPITFSSQGIGDELYRADRTINEAIKSTVDMDISTFDLAPEFFHSPMATPHAFEVRIEAEELAAQP